MLLINPHRSEANVNMPMAEANTHRVPNRSAIQPLTGNEDGEAKRVARQHGLHAERSRADRFPTMGTAVFKIVGVEAIP